MTGLQAPAVKQVTGEGVLLRFLYIYSRFYHIYILFGCVKGGGGEGWMAGRRYSYLACGGGCRAVDDIVSRGCSLVPVTGLVLTV